MRQPIHSSSNIETYCSGAWQHSEADGPNLEMVVSQSCHRASDFRCYAKVRVIMFLTAWGPKKDAPAAISLIQPLTKVIGRQTI
jgi:hypothetical protein